MPLPMARLLVAVLGPLPLVAAAADTPGRAWSPALLRDPAAWSADAGALRVDADGLHLTVPAGRTWTLAAASGLALPADAGRIALRVTTVGGGARWFVRIYGDLRERGQPRTLAVAQDETGTGEHDFEVAPGSWTPDLAPMQLQVGIEGAPGATLAVAAVDVLPSLPRPNRHARRERQAGQVDLARVELMPNHPQPYAVPDWRARAQAYDRVVFDLAARGLYVPLAWLDDSKLNGPATTFGLPSYVGCPHSGAGKPNSAEGVTCLGAVLGATLAGVDKRGLEHDYVAMCQAWYNRANGLELVLNRQQQETGGSFWYELWPQIVFTALADRYPADKDMAAIVQAGARRWREACDRLAPTPGGIPDFDHLAFDFRRQQPVDNGQWREPDAAAGVAWLMLAAWKRFGDEACLAAADRCLRFLEARTTNPYYEVLLPWGAVTAARLRAERGRAGDPDRLLRWCFEVSDCRGGWTVVVGRWGEFDCDGLLGSIDNRGGYAFAMNTFAQAAALVPVARYDSRYARALGKWMLNLANSARLFYPDALPPEHQSNPEWTGDPGHTIAYEGLRHAWNGREPYATGDPIAMNWGPKTNLGLYGSSYVGMLGAVVQTTDVPQVLQLDCLATDFFRDPAYPTYLYFNPDDAERTVTLAVGPEPRDLYDTVTHRFVARQVRDRAAVVLPPDGAAVIVVTPAGAPEQRDGPRLCVGGTAVDYAVP